MLALRYFTCVACDTVHADVTTPPECHGCGGGPIEEVAPGAEGAAYFAPSLPSRG